MPRIRTVKPEFFTSPDMAQLDVLGRLTFIGLWTHADDAGICMDEPRLIHAALFPLDDSVSLADLEDAIDALVAGGQLYRYSNGSRSYLQVVAWHHQVINRPGKSKFPAHDHPDSRLTEPSVSPHGIVTEPSVQEQGTGKGTGTGSVEVPDPTPDVSPTLSLAVASEPAKPAKARNPLFDALVDACGMDYTEMTKRQCDSTAVAAAQLRGVNADPNEVAARAAVYRRKFPNTTCTPNALASHWAALNPHTQPAGAPRLSKSMQAVEAVGQRLGLIQGGSQ
jgi:hypothetical protein